MSIISELKCQRDLIQDKINAIQMACTHPKEVLTKKSRSNTGGYDGPSSDSYWYDCECGLCEKLWSEDQ